MCTHRLPQHSDFRTAQFKLRCMCTHRLPQLSDFRTAQSKLRCMCTYTASLNTQTFGALMEGALLRKRKPRAYLVPSPTNKSVPSHPFKPTINKRSQKMAARLRPAELSPHDILHYNAEAVRAFGTCCVCVVCVYVCVCVDEYVCFVWLLH